jgi:phenylacetaldehyde dehydrogenase
MNAALSASRPDSLYSGFLSRVHQLFIDGKWTPAQSGETFAVLDPSTGREIAQSVRQVVVEDDLALVG